MQKGGGVSLTPCLTLGLGPNGFCSCWRQQLWDPVGAPAFCAKCTLHTAALPRHWQVAKLFWLLVRCVALCMLELCNSTVRQLCLAVWWHLAVGLYSMHGVNPVGEYKPARWAGRGTVVAARPCNQITASCASACGIWERLASHNSLTVWCWLPKHLLAHR